MGTESLEHDTLTEKAIRRPARDKAIKGPSPRNQVRQKVKHRAGREEEPWCRWDNEAIWDGDHDHE